MSNILWILGGLLLLMLVAVLVDVLRNGVGGKASPRQGEWDGRHGRMKAFDDDEIAYYDQGMPVTLEEARGRARRGRGKHILIRKRGGRRD